MPQVFDLNYEKRSISLMPTRDKYLDKNLWDKIIEKQDNKAPAKE